jgi:hypothetical protein
MEYTAKCKRECSVPDSPLRRNCRCQRGWLTSLQACAMILAPVLVTTPAISMLYQRAPLRMT